MELAVLLNEFVQLDGEPAACRSYLLPEVAQGRADNVPGVTPMSASESELQALSTKWVLRLEGRV
eukprot:1008745-Amphidinium_carterae.1